MPALSYGHLALFNGCMTNELRFARRLPATGLLALTLLLSACGAGSTTTTGPAATGGTTPGASATDGGSTPQPSANVTNTKSITDWTAQVCAAVKRMQVLPTVPDVSKIQSDPAGYMKQLQKQLTALPPRLEQAADTLEQIGAPDVPNGKEFTDAYIDGLRAYAAALRKAEAKATGPGGVLRFETFAKAMDSSQLRAAGERIRTASEKVTKSQELQAAFKADPTCKSLDAFTSQG